MSSRKRKHAAQNKPPITADIAIENKEPDPTLFIQAHEADLIRGPHARKAAQSLEVVFDRAGSKTGHTQWNVGDGLIKWGREEVAAQEMGSTGTVFHDEDDHVQQGGRNRDEVGVWVDRYDARLLLDTLPIVHSVPAESTPGSPTGWSDLPSDSEDTFFFAPAEAEDYRREKRRRMIDRNREERLKAMRAEDDDSADEVEAWGDSDEEPDETQKELMRRTATHILSSPNHAQLEMRILANYGGDKRFAFLRGRWSRSWKMIKGRVKMDKEKQEKDEKAGAGLGELAGYGDSEDEDDGNSVDETTISSPNRKPKADDEAEQSDDPVKEARRARAKAWAEKRRQKNG